MPLGNGEVAVNAWIEPDWQLRLFLARTDAWDEYGRLVKIGGLRFFVGQTSPEKTRHFRQCLTARDATLTASFGEKDPAEVTLRLWVDANRPIAYVEWILAEEAPATAQLDLWRTETEVIPPTEVSDVLYRHPDNLTMVIDPDVILKRADFVPGLGPFLGWYRHNRKSVGPELCARIQGVADFPRPDPLLGRTFGGLVTAADAQRQDAGTLLRPASRYHCFQIVVHTEHPATPERWLESAKAIVAEAAKTPLAERRQAHEKWWHDFWQRSWIHVWQTEGARLSRPRQIIPANTHPVRIGSDQSGGSRWRGQLGRVSILARAAGEEEVRRWALLAPAEPIPKGPQLLYTGRPEQPQILSELAKENFPEGISVEAWIRWQQSSEAVGRIVDKITPGGADGFLLDLHPAGVLRAIIGQHTVHAEKTLSAGIWHHVALVLDPSGALRVYHQGEPVIQATLESEVADDTFVVSRAYALQRFITACAGRGRYPIKFNGSLFTVPATGQPGFADYRRWGPGYWWQNTRLPYYGMCAAGDFDLMQPLFRMYAQELMPLFRFRTERYLGHRGAYIPECIYFWGDVFSATYGWQPAELRQDKLQESRWHKWEWVSGLELVWLLLDYWEHTQEEQFLQEVVLPTAEQILRFFDEHYPPGPDGKMYMYPAQALETWWDCVNPMPEVAGLHAVTARLLTLPPEVVPPQQREFWQRLQAKLPEIPLQKFEDGKIALAPAQIFRDKRNIENPELYAVFPFRLFAREKPNLAWALVALERRSDRGAFGWRQDDIFMCYLGLADEARHYLVERARRKHTGSRFPVFWGPNYDWIPDQDHGSVLVKALQSMLLQTDGRKIYLLPAWPSDWDADFRLHAPFRTVLEGKIRRGQLAELHVDPPARRSDVVVCSP
jgi:hypothetical protein